MDISGALAFLFCLVLGTISGLYLAAYAAHSFFMVVEQTAAGADAVEWPDEPYFDWLWKLIYLFWLAALWLVPLGLMTRWITGDDPGGEVRVLMWGCVLAWLLLPPAILMGLGSSGSLIFISPRVLGALAARLSSLMAFYFFTGPLLVLAGLCLFGLLVMKPFYPVVVCAPVGVALFLIYARLLGRLAAIINIREVIDEPVDATPAKPTAAAKPKRKRRPVRDPWGEPAPDTQPRDLPPVRTMDGDMVGYDVQFGNEPAPAPVAAAPASRPNLPFAEPGDYAIADAPLKPVAPPQLLSADPRERQLHRKRSSVTRLPRSPWTDGIYNFPTYPQTLPAAGWLVLWLVMVSLLLRGMRAS